MAVSAVSFKDIPTLSSVRSIEIDNLLSECTCPVSAEFMNQCVTLIPCAHKVQQAVAEKLFGMTKEEKCEKKAKCPVCNIIVSNYIKDPQMRNICEKLPSILNGLKSLIKEPEYPCKYPFKSLPLFRAQPKELDGWSSKTDIYVSSMTFKAARSLEIIFESTKHKDWGRGLKKIRVIFSNLYYRVNLLDIEKYFTEQGLLDYKTSSSADKIDFTVSDRIELSDTKYQRTKKLVRILLENNIVSDEHRKQIDEFMNE